MTSSGYKGICHVVSVSGGKDSGATLLLAQLRFPRGKIIPIFCDTGNEHQEVYDYLLYLEQALDIEIIRLKADLSGAVTAKRMFIARDRRTRREYDTVPVFDAEGNPVQKRDKFGSPVFKKGKDGEPVPVQKTRKVGGGRRVRWTNAAKRRALNILRPTGNPYLDLCLWKGRFPSRKAQFCTEELKRNPAVEFQLSLLDQGYTVVSWQGVRRDESANRRNVKTFECLGPGLYAYRPIADWTAEKVFAFHREHNLQPNPLYRQGMGRVGCMPCINAGKDELRQIAARFPDHIDRIAGWERLVSDASKRGHSTFFHKVDESGKAIDSAIFARNNVQQTVEWSRTTRGGRQFDLLAAAVEPTACSSAYGLCE